MKLAGLKSIENAHEDSVWAATWVPATEDRPSLLLTGSLDETVKLWRADELDLVRTNTGHSLGVAAVAAHPSGIIAASSSLDSFYKLEQRLQDDKRTALSLTPARLSWRASPSSPISWRSGQDDSWRQSTATSKHKERMKKENSIYISVSIVSLLLTANLPNHPESLLYSFPTSIEKVYMPLTFPLQSLYIFFATLIRQPSQKDKWNHPYFSSDAKQSKNTSTD
uniref:Uncharacterized protein n=1 Tax=Brassica campestris TaxID=3711 RepID=M4D1G7_BRACM